MDEPKNLITPHPTTPPTTPPQPDTPPSHSSTPIPPQPDTHPSHSSTPIPTSAQTQSHSQTVCSHTIVPINNSSQTMPTHLMVTRAKAGIFKLLERMNCHVTTTSSLPRSHVYALRDPNWKEDMLDEYNALITNGMWVLVPRPTNVNLVRSMWLFKHKFNVDGSLNRYKARLVANGRSQHQASSSAFLQWIIASLHSEFAMTDLGSLNYFLSISAQRSASGLFLSQSKFAEEIIERAHMQNCNPCRTPVDTESKLYFTALKRILRYVRGTIDHGLQLHVTLSCSSAEAEYRGVTNVVAETAWIWNLLLELHAPLSTATLVYCDNVSVVYLSTNPVNISALNTSRLIFNLSMNMLLSIKFVFFMSLPDFSMQIFLLRVSPWLYFIKFRSSLNVRRPPLKLWGVLAVIVSWIDMIYCD
nr:hypothetical protein [Tanacetum cinerariifolium]